MQRSGVTSAWIIVSVISAIVSWAVMYGLYVYLFPPVILVNNFVVSHWGSQYAGLAPLAANITSSVNAAFIIIAVGIFFFMLAAPYIFEPLSGSVEV